MAQPVTISDLLDQHPFNPVKETGYKTQSSKPWLKNHAPITKVTLQSYEVGTDGVKSCTQAVLDGPLLPLLEDDTHRLSEAAYPPNARQWRFSSESDAANWFHHEISNVMLPAFERYPAMTQVAEAGSLIGVSTQDSSKEKVDVMYTVGESKERHCAMIVEFKRNLIDPGFWMQQKPGPLSQLLLGRELRGYAFKYECPQIMCFDGSYLLMLQFRASRAADINNGKCPVDCWVIPRENAGGTTLRQCFYRFLTQGFRRCQGERGVHFDLDGARPSTLWWSGERQFQRGLAPLGWNRHIDLSYGAFYYAKNGDPQTQTWETRGFWDPPVVPSDDAMDVADQSLEEEMAELYD